MKKIIIYFLPAALAIMSLAGCNNDNNQLQLSGQSDCPEFTATIAGVQSRAFGQTWDPYDEIGVTGCDRFNVCYFTQNGDGNFAVKTTGEQIYFQTDDEALFTAYYPWRDLNGVTSIDVVTDNQAYQKNFDFLWAQAEGKKSSSKVSFNFTHKMAKVVFTVNSGEDMSFAEAKSAILSLSGFSQTGSFNPTDGSTQTGEISSDPWIFSSFVQYNEAEEKMTYSLIFLPQELKNPLELIAELPLDNKNYHLRASIDFTDANSDLDKSDAKNEWVAGRQYNLKLTLNKTALALDGCVIQPWDEVIGKDISVE